ncbi:MAG: peptidylprolyl isomerase [Planctomycetota bacterium]|nr:peptidylprolyl isomerase [Planctomycetota bacterium]MDA1210987.1 peptidylprolyl isomerase [Planctomycetota bacterium]
MRHYFCAILSVSLFLCTETIFHSVMLRAQSKDTTLKSVAAGKALVTVNGTPITTASAELWMMMHAIPTSQREAFQEQATQLLVDEELVAQFLRSRRIEASEMAIDKMIIRWKKLVAAEKRDPSEWLGKHGISDSMLRETLSLMPRWDVYLNEIVTRDTLNEYFESHRQEFDGTRVRVSQIMKKLSSDATEQDVAAVQAELTTLKSKIESGSLTFADAAKKHSEAPSRSQGGDIGSFTFRGVMAKEITEVAFQLQPGDISEPFRSPFGIHLIVVTDRQAGQLSLEDVRAQVLEELGQSIWTSTVTELRDKADIQ